jgi:class 3 adenylate cyclase
MNFSDSRNRRTSERVERQLATISVADVVGCSRLTRNDEEATHRRLTVLQSDAVPLAIARHRRRVTIPRIEPNGEFA